MVIGTIMAALVYVGSGQALQHYYYNYLLKIIIIN